MVSALSDKDYRNEISASINTADIDQQLRDKGLIGESINCYRPRTLQENAEIVLRNVEERGEEALADLLWCLEQTSDGHIGHRYAMDVLTNKMYDLETLADITTSCVLKRRYRKIDTKRLMVEGLDVRSLLPQLIQKGLLTDREADEIQSGRLTRKRLVIKLEGILANKGPLAHLYFTEALIEAKNNSCLYQDIFNHIFDDVDESLTDQEV